MSIKTLLKHLCVVFIAIQISCSDDDDSSAATNNNNKLSKNQILQSKNWTSVKVFNSGIDVTNQAEKVTYNFRANNNYTVSSTTGSSDGTWSLGSNILKLDGNDWMVIELTSSSLKIDDQAVVKIYFE